MYSGDIPTYVMWRIMGTLIVIAAIWAITVTTRLMRGDEELGRHELVLAKSTTPLRITLNIITAMSTALAIQLVIMSLITMGSNTAEGVSFSIGDAVLLSATILAGAVLFGGIAMLTSQLYAARRRAALAASVVLMIMFVLRGAIGINKDLNWARFISPLTWLENVQPLTEKNYAWFAPVLLIAGICISGAMAIIKNRDMGSSVIEESGTKRKKSRLLGSALSSSFLFMRSSVMVWAVVIVSFTSFMASLSKTVADALNDSAQFQRTVANITGASATAAIKIFLGMVMFIGVTLLMIAAVGFIGSLRSEESSGQLDALIVRPVMRIRWWLGRIGIAVGAVVVIALLVALASWLTLPDNSGIGWVTMLQAGINMVFPTVMLMGFCVFVFGVRPRLTTALGYGLIGWSFLMEIIVSLFWPNSKALNLSLYHHLVLVPAADINWTKSFIMLAIGAVLAIIGAYAFRNRDLQGE
jgi:ABC-2 type transport system permease protein